MGLAVPRTHSHPLSRRTAFPSEFSSIFLSIIMFSLTHTQTHLFDSQPATNSEHQHISWIVTTRKTLRLLRTHLSLCSSKCAPRIHATIGKEKKTETRREVVGSAATRKTATIFSIFHQLRKIHPYADSFGNFAVPFFTFSREALLTIRFDSAP